MTSLSESLTLFFTNGQLFSSPSLISSLSSIRRIALLSERHLCFFSRSINKFSCLLTILDSRASSLSRALALTLIPFFPLNLFFFSSFLSRICYIRTTTCSNHTFSSLFLLITEKNFALPKYRVDQTQIRCSNSLSSLSKHGLKAFLLSFSHYFLLSCLSL